MVETIAGINALVLRPFRERVDIEGLVLLLVLATALAGMWHLVIERIEL